MNDDFSKVLSESAVSKEEYEARVREEKAKKELKKIKQAEAELFMFYDLIVLMIKEAAVSAVKRGGYIDCSDGRKVAGSFCFCYDEYNSPLVGGQVGDCEFSANVKDGHMGEKDGYRRYHIIETYWVDHHPYELDEKRRAPTSDAFIMVKEEWNKAPISQRILHGKKQICVEHNDDERIEVLIDHISNAFGKDKIKFFPSKFLKKFEKRYTVSSTGRQSSIGEVCTERKRIFEFELFF